MEVEFESEPATEEQLLAEHLDDVEVRQVLERLSFEQFVFETGATVGAVVEATGATPLTIARIVGEIRKTSFEARFQQTFGQHDRRIEALEGTTKSLKHQLVRALRRTRSAPEAEPVGKESDWEERSQARVFNVQPNPTARQIESARRRRNVERTDPLESIMTATLWVVGFCVGMLVIYALAGRF